MSLYSLIGTRVSHVVAVGRGRKNYTLLCSCDCGGMTEVQGGVFKRALREGRGVSCGCQKRKLIGVGNQVHGMTGSPTWKSWASMLDRCEMPSHKSYRDYGGRGITVCEQWRDFEAFLRDMGVRPKGTTLGRINNDGNYEPANCEWQDSEAQMNNRRSTRFIEFSGVSKSLEQWARATGVARDTLAHRLAAGWSVERALTTPARLQSNSRPPTFTRSRHLLPSDVSQSR